MFKKYSELLYLHAIFKWMKKSFVLFLLVQFAFAQELALVRKDGKFGYISKNGEFAIQPKYKTAKNFSEGLAAAEENGKWGFIDAKGEVSRKNAESYLENTHIQKIISAYENFEDIEYFAKVDFTESQS